MAGLQIRYSVFRVDPRNILGLDHQRFKSQLLSLALAEPAKYFKLRYIVYTTIVEEAVSDAYDLYWNILRDGRREENCILITIETKKYTNQQNQFFFTFIPSLPESEINTFALEVAEAVKDIAERCIEKIMPMEIKDLAVGRSKEILPDV